MNQSLKKAVKTLILSAQARDVHLVRQRLQKLLYLAHGLCLAKHGIALAEGLEFQAWRYGPIVESLHHYFKVIGSSPVRSDLLWVEKWDALSEEILEDRQRIECINAVVRQFGSMDIGQLISVCRDPNGPWAEIMNDQDSGIVLRDKTIQTYFYAHLA